MANTRLRGTKRRAPGDMTGRKSDAQSTAVAEQQQEAARAMSMATAAAEAKRDEVVDYSDDPEPPRMHPPKEPVDYTEDEADATIEAIVSQASGRSPEPQQVGGVIHESGATVVQDDTVTVRAEFDVSDVTLGNAAKPRDFQQGQKYVLKRGHAQHLAERGLVTLLG